MAEPLILADVTARASPQFAVGPVSFELAPGQALALVGENGSGKTSLLRAILGELSIESGEVRFGPDWANLDLVGRARVCAMVPQIEATPFHFTAREAVLLGRLPHAKGQWESEEDLKLAEDALRFVNAESYGDRRMEELSGGERQRVRIARALAQQPQLLLLDEPTAHIDLPARTALLGLLQKLAKSSVAIVVTTHDLEWGTALADQLIVLRAGKVVAQSFDVEAVAAGLGVAIEAVGSKPILRPRLG